MAKRKAKVDKGPCRVPACKKSATTLGFCNACYARTYYWHRKSLKEKVARMEQIQVWENSLEIQCGDPSAFDREKIKKGEIK